jgi:hypothetical protein
MQKSVHQCLLLHLQLNKVLHATENFFYSEIFLLNGTKQYMHCAQYHVSCAYSHDECRMLCSPLSHCVSWGYVSSACMVQQHLKKVCKFLSHPSFDFEKICALQKFLSIFPRRNLSQYIYIYVYICVCVCVCVCARMPILSSHTWYIYIYIYIHTYIYMYICVCAHANTLKPYIIQHTHTFICFHASMVWKMCFVCTDELPLQQREVASRLRTAEDDHFRKLLCRSRIICTQMSSQLENYMYNYMQRNCFAALKLYVQNFALHL